ncbi:MAG: hypothetical protein E4H14_14705 [Candidatus Thorarchaeota archaeon]|jgi:uncharacterized membrane protein (DUF2068 family)|nr:MAG: hypothetical protein E4H14_14705 [Candidatus Thorarchaeota archaeon]
MSRPLGVTILAILQLLGALSLLVLGGLAVLTALLLAPILILLAAIPLIIGIIGFILFWGLWNLKSWAWIWTIVVNLITIITSIFDPWNNMINLIISLLIVVYMFSPGVKSHFR